MTFILLSTVVVAFIIIIIITAASKVLSSDSMEQNPSVEVNKLLKFWLIHSLAFLQG